MKVKDLKLVLEQYADDSLICVEVSLGTTYRLDRCIIKPMSFNDDLTPVKTAEKCEQTGMLVLKFE
jgi:hypothetical protein